MQADYGSHDLRCDEYQDLEIEIKAVSRHKGAEALRKFQEQGRALRKPKPPPVICDVDVLTGGFKELEQCNKCLHAYTAGTKHDCPNSPTKQLNEMQKAYLQMHEVLENLLGGAQFEQLDVMIQDEVEKAVKAGEKWI